MLFLPKYFKRLKSLFPLPLAFAALVFIFAFIPPAQSSGDPGVQGDVFAGATITTTTQSAVVACGQGAGHIGRKTLVVENQAAGGVVTVTAELRTSQTAPNFTSGYLAVNGATAGAATSATTSTTAAGGRFCRVTAVSASTSVVTVTLRRE